MSFIRKLTKLIKKPPSKPVELRPVDSKSVYAVSVSNPDAIHGNCAAAPESEYAFVPKQEQYFVDTSKQKTEEKKAPTKEDMQKQFDVWYTSLTAEERNKIDKKILKSYLRTGSLVVCERCKKPGGKFGNRGYTLKKVDDKYYHVGDCPKD